MNQRAPAILDRLASLADTTRSRILLLLDQHPLTVSELCSIMTRPAARPRRSDAPERERPELEEAGDLDPAARRLWLLVREQVGPMPAAAEDARRLQAALAERRTRSQEFAISAAARGS
jgi:hypothetical protein